MMTNLKTRRQRRIDAKEAGVPFEPQYSSGAPRPRTFEEVYGRKVGERKPKSNDSSIQITKREEAE